MRRAAILAAALLAGCTHNEPLSLHGAASMRVEVEVYKGPLSVPVQGQVGEILGVLSDSIHAVYEWRVQAKRVCSIGDVRPDCEALASAIETGGDILDSACYIIESPTFSEITGRATYVPRGTCRQFKDERRYELAAIERPPYEPGAEADEGRDRSSPSELAQALLAEDRQAVAKAKSQPESAASLRSRLAVKAAAAGVKPGRAADIYMLQKAVDDCVAQYHAPKPLPMLAQLKCEGEVISVALDNFSATLRGAARRAADANVRRVSADDRARRLLVEYAAMTAEYGEQIHARITVLQKQMSPRAPADLKGPILEQALIDVRDPKTLPVSDYLRSAARTDYIHLFDWLQGGERYAGDEWRMPDTRERIRMVERLTNESSWQKVNEVYASGQGDTAMAFIKDDLGNWDLKSFSSDPSELLESYRRVTDAALKTAADLTRKVATGAPGAAVERLGAAQRAASLANQLASGEVPATPGVVGGVNIATLHDRAAERIVAQKARFEILERRLTQERDAQAAAAKAAADDKTAADGQVTGETAALEKARTDRDQANEAYLDARAALAAKKTEEGADTSAEEAALARATTLLDERQKAVDAAQAQVLTAKAAASAAETKRAEAVAKGAAAEQRLLDLPKEAIEAVRGTLDDHLAVVAALQEGVASPPTPTGAPAR